MTSATTNPTAGPQPYLYHRHGRVTLYLGDAAHVLATLPPDSVDCVVTSPPFWGHRDYGTGTWTGGHPTCGHYSARRDGDSCPRCGATWHDPQYGLEATFEEYLDHLLGVFDQLKRVLHPEGTCWLNLGDTYSANHRTTYDTRPGITGRGVPEQRPAHQLPGKNLIGVPWRTALALQANGWIIRQCVIWLKPNAMPESVRDRPSSNYEHLFLLTRSPRYHFDLDPIRIPLAHPDKAGTPIGAVDATHPAVGASARRRHPRRSSPKYTSDPAAHHGRGSRGNLLATGTAHTTAHPNGRNPGSVWSIPTRPSRLPHYAGYPLDLPLRCIAAGSPPGGVVLDPFSGTATTGAAALQLGRSYTGIDLNAAYHDLALERLAAARTATEPGGASRSFSGEPR
jgi:site-specific DNA-methyltransferase (cytosine-N4-specific)